MGYIKFKNDKKFYEAIVEIISDSVLRIIGDFREPNLSGFHYYLQENEEYPLDKGEYIEFTTLYKEGKGWYELSNNGEIYTEPEPIPEPEPEVPTEEEIAEQERLNQILNRQSVIEALKRQIESTDYQIIKTYEYFLVGAETDYDIAEIHSSRQELRNQINNLEAEIKILQEN